MTILRLDRRGSGEPERNAVPDDLSVDLSERKANAFHFWYLAASVVWILGTDAILDRLRMPIWVGSLKDIVYLAACGLALRRAVSVYLGSVRRSHRAQLEAKRELVGRLAMAAEYRDDETGSHNHRIALSAKALGAELGLSPQECDHLFYAAALHDLGKIAVPDGILHKRGPLDPEERAHMQRHASLGAALLANSPHPLLRMAHDVALSHHERWDGGGYPHGLRGEEIPLVGRIVAVCDVYDALTSERPYKRAWSVEAALEEIERGSGSHFDPQVVRAFLSWRERNGEARLEAKPWDAYREAA